MHLAYSTKTSGLAQHLVYNEVSAFKFMVTCNVNETHQGQMTKGKVP